jgi:hypothetical protein
MIVPPDSIDPIVKIPLRFQMRFNAGRFILSERLISISSTLLCGKVHCPAEVTDENVPRSGYGGLSCLGVRRTPTRFDPTFMMFAPLIKRKPAA